MGVNTDISRQVVAIGIDFVHSKGGVPEVERYHSSLLVPYRFIPTSIDGGKLKKALWGAAALVRLPALLAFDRDIRIVHAHVCSGNSFWRKRLLIRIARLMGKKVVFHLHGGGFADFYRANQARVRPVIDSCDHVVALSENWRRFFQDTLGYDRSRVTVIPNGIMPPGNNSASEAGQSSASASEARQSAAPDSGRMQFLFLGSINRNKGLFDLVEAIASRAGSYRGRLEITICGVGEVDRLRKAIEDAGVADIIRYGGWVSGSAKTALLMQCDGFILPSYIEGLPVCVLEAMSFGKPVIATTVGGIPDVIENGVNGILIAPGDKDALARALDSALADPASFRAMGQASLPVIADYYPERISARLESLYAKLLNRP